MPQYQDISKIPEFITSLLFESIDECFWFRLKPNTKNKFSFNEDENITFTISYEYIANEKIILDIVTLVDVAIHDVFKVYLQKSYITILDPIYINPLQNDCESIYKTHHIEFTPSDKSDKLYLGLFIGEWQAKPNCFYYRG